MPPGAAHCPEHAAAVTVAARDHMESQPQVPPVQSSWKTEDVPTARGTTALGALSISVGNEAQGGVAY